LNIGGFYGNAGDEMAYHNGMGFSTPGVNFTNILLAAFCEKNDETDFLYLNILFGKRKLVQKAAL
jgi:hypothetical protein